MLRKELSHNFSFFLLTTSGGGELNPSSFPLENYQCHYAKRLLEKGIPCPFSYSLYHLIIIKLVNK